MLQGKRLYGNCRNGQMNSRRRLFGPRHRKNPLYAALEEMRSAGLIKGRLLEWAQGLRVLGNDAAHFTVRSVSREDAEDALGLAEALLDYMYVLSAEFQKFRDRRTALPPNKQATNLKGLPHSPKSDCGLSVSRASPGAPGAIPDGATSSRRAEPERCGEDR